jgi:gliding motility-associated-like protein
LGNNDSAVLRVKPTRVVQWFKDGNLISGASQDVFRVTQSGSYFARVNNNDGCIATTRTEKILIDQPRLGIKYPFEYAVTNSPYQLQAREFGTRVQWMPSMYLSNASIVNPIFQSASDQSYNIRIETATGCITVDTVLVKTAPAAGIFVPTAFTPNSDGRNDRLFPVLMGAKELRYFRIFNRWGQLLFETKQLNTGWDGRINGVMQNAGVVVWVAEAVGADKRIYQQKGTTMIVR